jgi:hypothetical protein
LFLTKETHQTTTTKKFDSDNSDDSDSDFEKGDDDANTSEDGHDVINMSRKELRDMVLAAAKTALSMSKRTTRKVQRGNEAKTTKRTALRKEKDEDKSWERRLFCVSSLDYQVTSTNDSGNRNMSVICLRQRLT